MIRITGGQLKGQTVFCPKGDAVRPTTAFVRESLFSILGARLFEAKVLDLFAGSGIVGMEALSRGAALVEAVEKSPAHARLIEKSMAKFASLEKQHHTVVSDVGHYLKQNSANASYDLIYLDPPYTDAALGLACVAQIFDQRWLSPSGWVILEHPPKLALSAIAGATHLQTRRYGESALSFWGWPETE